LGVDSIVISRWWSPWISTQEVTKNISNFLPIFGCSANDNFHCLIKKDIRLISDVFRSGYPPGFFISSSCDQNTKATLNQ
jgi:hypothetical protein